MVKPPVYMDNQATTRVDERVVAAMVPFFSEQFGNAGSDSHPFGWEARDAVASARQSIAGHLNAHPREIVFTSGATESNNLALFGACQRKRRRGDHMITVGTEHKAVLDPVARIQRRGFEVTYVEMEPAGSPNAGWVDPEKVRAAIRDDTVMVSIMLANNETGIILPLAEIGRICKEQSVLLHTDATQAVGKIPVDVDALGVDLLSFSAHKIYGPKGVGGLYVRRKDPLVRLDPLIEGGGQEGGRRSGTLNVPGIVGMATALDLCSAEMASESERLKLLRDRLWTGFNARVAEVELNGPRLDAPELRLTSNLNCSFANVDGEALMMSMRDLAVSSGSACTSANPEPSHVLRAMGLPSDLCRASLRFGLGRFNTEEEVEFAIDLVAEAVERLRKMARPM